MSKTKILISGAALTIGLALLPATSFGRTIPQRQRTQQARIRQGIRSGELTGREAAHLERAEGRLRANYVRDRITGGGISPREHAQLEREANRTSRQIYRDKHNYRVQ